MGVFILCHPLVFQPDICLDFRMHFMTLLRRDTQQDRIRRGTEVHPSLCLVDTSIHPSNLEHSQCIPCARITGGKMYFPRCHLPTKAMTHGKPETVWLAAVVVHNECSFISSRMELDDSSPRYGFQLGWAGGFFLGTASANGRSTP